MQIAASARVVGRAVELRAVGGTQVNFGQGDFRVRVLCVDSGGRGKPIVGASVAHGRPTRQARKRCRGGLVRRALRAPTVPGAQQARRPP